MVITPISGINVNSIKLSEVGKQQTEFIPFKKVFEEMVENVNKTDAIAKQDAYKIAAGQTDDLHNIMINAEKADLSLQLMVQVRNKVIDAYNEIMRITL